MNTLSGSTFDSISDLYEIGLVAAASPEFAERMIRALIAAGEDADVASVSNAASATQPAPCGMSALA